MHVEVVIGALFDALQRLDLGQDDGGQRQLVEQRQAAQRVGATEQLAQLDELLGAAGLTLSAEAIDRLDTVSAGDIEG